MSNIVKIQNQLPVKSVSDIREIGEALAKSGMFGKINDSAGLVIMSTCYMEGITPLQYQRKYHTIEGVPTMKASAMAAEFRQRGGRYRVIECSPSRAAAEFTWEGQTVTFERTIEWAQSCDFYWRGDKKGPRDNWKNGPERMLWARLISWAINMLAPEISAGLYTPEETMDFIDAEHTVIEMEPVTVDNPPTPINKQQEPTPFDEPTVDYSVCPIPGKAFGKSWDGMETKALKIAIGKNYAEVTEGHKEAIRKIITERGLNE